jgi:hypothetical protein
MSKFFPRDIRNHSGKKYLRTIKSAVTSQTIEIDVYSVIWAFAVDPVVAHAVKKLLCAGQRGKGDQLQDWKEARDCLTRVIDHNQEEVRDDTEPKEEPKLVGDPGEAEDRSKTPHWESFPYIDKGNIVGFGVRWSRTDKEGKWLHVGHYYTGENGLEPSLGWCEIAADAHAKRLNNKAKCPWEYPGWGIDEEPDLVPDTVGLRQFICTACKLRYKARSLAKFCPQCGSDSTIIETTPNDGA